VNGHFSDELSELSSLPSGVKAGSLAKALGSDPALLEKHLGRYALTSGNSFAALNQAFFLDGAFIFV
jgi:Fe-S cluster assembly protein SufD